MTDEKATATYVAIHLTGMAIVGGLYYGVVCYKERKKRKMIKAWEAENIDLIEQSHNRLVATLQDPDFNLANFYEAMREEDRWIASVMDATWPY